MAMILPSPARLHKQTPSLTALAVGAFWGQNLDVVMLPCSIALGLQSQSSTTEGIS
jgi:hypothetical protein